MDTAQTLGFEGIESHLEPQVDFRGTAASAT